MATLRSVAFLLLLGCGAPASSAHVEPVTLAPPPPPPVTQPAPSAQPITLEDPPIPEADIEAVTNPSQLPTYTGTTGVIEGTVYVTGAGPSSTGQSFRGCAAARATFGKTFREGVPTPSGARPLADVVVGITGYAGYVVREREPTVKVHVTDCGDLAERTVVLTFGQGLEVRNDTIDPIAPRLLDQEASGKALLRGGAIVLRPRRPAHYHLADEIHPWIRADVLVAATPLHAVTDPGGHFRIEGVPVGNVTVNAWHPALAHEVKTTADVHGGDRVHVELSIPNGG